MIRILLIGFSVALLAVAAAYGAEPVVDRDQDLELIRSDFGLADGPSWNDRGVLYVPDVKGQKLFQYSPRQQKWTSVLSDEFRISATFFNGGELYVSDNANSRIAVLDGKELKTVYQHDPDIKPPARPNDLVVDVHGGIYYTLTARGEVCYITPDHKTSTVVGKVDAPNGIILSPSESILYVSAYAAKEIWAFDVKEPGTLSEGRKFAVMDDGPEKGADGMCTDRAGNVYCCGATDVWIWNPEGKLLDKLTTPTRPINCTFGDPEMQSLYITGFGGLYRQAMNISGRSPEPEQKTSSREDRRLNTVIPDGIEAHRNVPYAEYGSRKLLADLFVPTAASQNPAVIVVHGGGWVKGDKTKFRAMAIALAERGYTTMAIEYRLGGEEKFPAASHDCSAAVRFLRAHAEQFRINPDQIGAIGGSAGGHLVGLMATGSDVSELQGSGGWNDQPSRLQAAIVMAGPLEMTTGSVADRSRTQPQSFSNVWLGQSIDQAPELYELADVCQKISADDCPILFLVGELDHPERNELSRERLKKHSIATDVTIYAGARHGCWNQLPWFDQVVEDTDRFFRSHLQTQ
ncbi:SMP-30/gluconolactonase/LRE family protein [Rubinisphaera margarita]|uniref:SMP-30/gluconolactonase/LRE family protein n=1 Tax=Rubinisphaera margarita TaxID=2909586 RepID=UPI001EE78198|nr:SMP-30/gluconolactonase/LRE family protein [Rubinisphaera margarita]MCG6155010.1 SMP-30/gluconolactonase/LRE family protein [Rubinisphaera margarita]